MKKNLLTILILSLVIGCGENQQYKHDHDHGFVQVSERSFGKVYEPRHDTMLTEILNNAKKEDVDVLIFFSMSGCRYCDQMEPVIFSMARDLKTTLFLKVKLENCPEYTRKNGVRSFPTFMVAGKQAKIVGATSKDRLIALLGAN